MPLTSYDPQSRIQEINRVLSAVANRNTDVLKYFMPGNSGEVIKNKEYEWIDVSLNSFRDSLVSTAVTAATQIVVTNGTQTGLRPYIANRTVVQIGDEQLLVTSVVTVGTNQTTLNVTRAVSGTTAASQAAGSRVDIVSNAAPEGFDANRDDSEKGVKRTNITQIFERQLILTGTAQALTTVGNETKMATQAEYKMKELMKEAQKALIHGRYLDDSASGLRRWRGLKQWAEDAGNKLPSSTFGGSPTALNTALIESIIELYDERGGDMMSMMLLVPYAQQKNLNALKASRIVGGGQSQSERSIDNFVEKYTFGTNATVEVVLTSDLAPSEVMFLQKDRIKVKQLEGRGLVRKPLGKTGDNDKELIITELGLEVRNARETLYHITGVTV